MLLKFFGLDKPEHDESYWDIIQNSTFRYVDIDFQYPAEKHQEFVEKYSRVPFTNFRKDQLYLYPTDDLIYIEKSIGLGSTFYFGLTLINAALFGGLAYYAWRYGPRSVKILRIKKMTKANIFKYGCLTRHYLIRRVTGLIRDHSLLIPQELQV